MLSGVKEIRAVVDRARHRKSSEGRDTLLFVDEVHRFNKSQQDAFLPHIEDGTFIFVGATTENPSFELNSALLSRTRVYVLKNLEDDEILRLLQRALESDTGFAGRLTVPQEVLEMMATAAGGDARRALNILEVAADLAEPDEQGRDTVSEAQLEQVMQTSLRRFDKGGDVFTIRSLRCTNRCAARTRTEHCTGCAGCLMGAATRYTQQDGWYGLPVRTSETPIRGLSS